MNILNKIITTGYKLIKSTYKATYKQLSQDPLKFFTNLLYFQADLQQPKFYQISHSQSLLVPFQNTLNDYAPVCTVYDELPIHYHIIFSGEDLRSVKYFSFGNTHTNATHRILNAYFMSKLSDPHDHMRFEGIDTSMELDCDKICINKELEVSYMPDCHFLLNLPKDRICKGWDNTELVLKLHEQAEYMKTNLIPVYEKYIEPAYKIMVGLNHKINSWDNKKLNLMDSFYAIYESLLLAYQKLYPTLIDEYHWENIKNEINLLKTPEKLNVRLAKAEIECFKSLHKMWQVFDKKIAAQSGISKNDIIGARNPLIIAQYENFKNKPFRLFTEAGNEHYVTTEGLADLENESVDETDYQNELREYIRNSPDHAILIPK